MTWRHAVIHCLLEPLSCIIAGWNPLSYVVVNWGHRYTLLVTGDVYKVPSAALCPVMFVSSDVAKVAELSGYIQ